MAKIKLQRRESAPKNEGIGDVTRNTGRYKEAFMIDCGTPENALALADAISKEAYDHPAGSKLDDAGRHFLGGEIVQFWPIGRFFTACIDPCDKAIEWCQNFLKNLGGAAPALTGNDAGLESKTGEALSPKLALRSKLNRVDDHLKGLYAFNSVIGRSAKELHDKGFDLDMGCGDKADCETEAKKALSDFDDYVEYNIVSEMENGKPYWYVDIKFKPAFWELGDSELGEVLTLLNGAIEEYC